VGERTQPRHETSVARGLTILRRCSTWRRQRQLAGNRGSTTAELAACDQCRARPSPAASAARDDPHMEGGPRRSPRRYGHRAGRGRRCWCAVRIGPNAAAKASLDLLGAVSSWQRTATGGFWYTSASPKYVAIWPKSRTHFPGALRSRSVHAGRTTARTELSNAAGAGPQSAAGPASTPATRN
jgi:hypothetical protein